MAIDINNANSLPTSQVQDSRPSQAVPVNQPAVQQVANSALKDVTADSASFSNGVQEREALEIKVRNINDFVQNIQRSIHFSVSEVSGRTVIEVYDKETDELIREIPSEDVQRISEAIAEQLSEGLLVKTNI